MTLLTQNALYCFDEGFFECSLVSAQCLLANTPEELKITLAHVGLKPASIDRLQKFQNLHGYRVTLRCMDTRLPEVTGSHLTNTALLRLVALTKFEGRVLYLDGDTLVRSGINELLNLPLDDKIVAAAVCPTHYSWWYKSRSRFRPGHQRNKRVVEQRLLELGTDTLLNYVNSGMFIIDVTQLRKSGLTEKFIDLETAARWRWHDQDHLNVTLRNRIKVCDSTFNSIWGNASFRNYVIPKTLRLQQHGAMTNPKIVHFAGKQKPWKLDKQRLGMKLRRLISRRLEAKFINEWVSAKGELDAAVK